MKTCDHERLNVVYGVEVVGEYMGIYLGQLGEKCLQIHNSEGHNRSCERQKSHYDPMRLSLRNVSAILSSDRTKLTQDSTHS